MSRLTRRLDFAVGVPLVAALSPFSRREPVPLGRPARVLVIKLAAAGDTLVLVPALRALRQALPEAEIDWLVSPINLGFARNVPYVNRLFVKTSSGPAHLAALASALRRRRYDAVIDAEQWARGTAVLAFLTGAPVRVGFDTPGQFRAALFTRRQPKRFDRHEAEEFLGLFGLLTPIAGELRLELPVDADAEAAARRAAPTLFEPGRTPRVLIHPGCGDDGFPREWPLDRYAALATLLIEKWGADIYLSAGPDEPEKTRALNTMLGGRAVDLGGRLTWPATAAVLGRMDLVVSGNTGIMHVAAALGRPQVALHGPTNSALWGPLNAHATVIASTCPHCPSLKLGFEYHASDGSCMRRIDIAEVYAAAVARLAAGDRFSPQK